MNRGVNLTNSICQYLLEFVSAILTSLLYYAFFGFVYIFLKKLSPDSDISKRFYNPINNDKENRLFNFMEHMMNYIFKNAIIFCIIIFISVLLIIISYGLKYVPIIEYMISSEALRLQKYIVENLLTIVLAVVGSVVIFSSLDKKYYLFFSSKDIVKLLKVKENVSTIILFYLLCIISTSGYYIGYYIVDNKDNSEVIKAFSFSISIVSSITVLVWLLKLFYSIILFLFSDRAENKLLDSLYYDIHNTNFKKIYISNEGEIEKNLEYLLSRLSNQLKLCDEKIFFISFLEEYNNFTKSTKRKNFIRTIIFAIIVNLFFAWYLSQLIKPFQFSLFSIILIIVFNIIESYIIYHTELKKIFIHAQMWSWGFLIEKGEQKYYCSTTKNNITKKEYDEYFKCLYNIVCLYKIVLLSDEKWIDYCLNEIIKYANDKGDYILYSVCLYLYYSKYRDEKAKLLRLKRYVKNNNINLDLLQNNIVAIINDIYRYDSRDDVEKFIFSLKKSSVIVKIHKAKNK